MEELIQLGDSLDIATVAACREQWQAAMAATPSGVRVAVDRLQRLDTAGLQLLLAFRNEALAQGKTFSIVGNSDQLRTQAATLGLVADLCLDLGPGRLSP